MPETAIMPPAGPGRGLLGHATDAECIAALLKEVGRLRAALQEIADRSPSSFERSDDPSSVIEWAQEALNHVPE